MDRMVVHQPAFCDITWGAGGSTSALTLEIANKMQNMVRNYKPESSNQSLEFEIWICFFLQFEIWCCLYLLLLWWASQSNEFSIFLWLGVFLMVPTYYGIGVHNVMCDPSWWTLILLLIGNLLSPSILFSCSSFWGTLHTLQPVSRTQANLASYECVFLISLAFTLGLRMQIDISFYLELLLVENPV